MARRNEGGRRRSPTAWLFSDRVALRAELRIGRLISRRTAVLLAGDSMQSLIAVHWCPLLAMAKLCVMRWLSSRRVPLWSASMLRQRLVFGDKSTRRDWDAKGQEGERRERVALPTKRTAGPGTVQSVRLRGAALRTAISHCIELPASKSDAAPSATCSSRGAARRPPSAGRVLGRRAHARRCVQMFRPRKRPTVQSAGGNGVEQRPPTCDPWRRASGEAVDGLRLPLPMATRPPFIAKAAGGFRPGSAPDELTDTQTKLPAGTGRF